MQTGTTILFIRAQKSHCNFRLGGLNLSPPVRWAVHPTPLAHAVAWGFMGGVHATERWPSGLQSAPPTFPEPLHPCWVLPYLILRGMSSRSGSSVAPPLLLRCAPEGAAAPREAHENTRGEAWPPVGGAGGFQGARSRDTSAKIPF